MANRQHYTAGTAAGFKGNSLAARETGRDAAEDVTETLARRHRQMMDAWAPYGAVGAIPEQVSGDIDLPAHHIRPRCGELVKRGLMFEVGKRPGQFGKGVMAYSVVRPFQPQEGEDDQLSFLDQAA